MHDEVEMLSAILCEPVGKRSKETPAREHPKAEQADAEKRAAGRSKFTSSDNPQVFLQQMNEAAQAQSPIPEGEIEKQIYELLSVKPIQIDALCKQFKTAAIRAIGCFDDAGIGRFC